MLEIAKQEIEDFIHIVHQGDTVITLALRIDGSTIKVRWLNEKRSVSADVGSEGHRIDLYVGECRGKL